MEADALKSTPSNSPSYYGATARLWKTDYISNKKVDS